MLEPSQLILSLKQAEASLLLHLEEVNQINVFPVADNDTGTNLYNTIRGAASSLSPLLSFKQTIDQYARFLFLKASGNSGMMFSMLVSKFANLLNVTKTVSQEDYLQALVVACQQTKGEIENFQPGTLITYVEQVANEILLLELTFDVAERSSLQEIFEQCLQKTAIDNPFLNEQKLIDAGALGLHHWLMGLFISNESDDLSENELQEVAAKNFEQVCEHSFETTAPNHRYCVQATLEIPKESQATLKDDLIHAGDCSLSLFQGTQGRFHVHSDAPKDLFAKLMDYAVVSDLKIEDMQMQCLAAKTDKQIALVCDSSVNLPPDFANKYLVHTIPITITQGSQVMLDGLSIDSAGLMTRVKKLREYPKTASPSFGTVNATFAWLSKHYEQVLVVSVSAVMSATYKTFRQVASFYPNITVVDSKKNSGAHGLVVASIAERLEQGESLQSVMAEMEHIRQASDVFVLVNDFKAMIRSGRIGRGKALFAKAINLKPIIGIDSSGTGEVIAKTLSRTRQQEILIKLIRKRYHSKGIKRFFILHSGNEDEAQALSAKLEQALNQPSLGLVKVSTSIQLHAGSGALAVAIEGES